MQPPHTDEPVLNLELLEQIELARHGVLQRADLKSDIIMLAEWLEPRPCPRCESQHREWLQQPALDECR